MDDDDNEDGDCTYRMHFSQRHLLPYELWSGVLLRVLFHMETGMETPGCWRGQEPEVPQGGCSWGMKRKPRAEAMTTQQNPWKVGQENGGHQVGTQVPNAHNGERMLLHRFVARTR